jgi:hypothetical protein
VGDWWDAAGLYGLGVVTGAILCGWFPKVLERWEARRRAWEEGHQAWRNAEDGRESPQRKGNPAEITDAEWEDYLTTKQQGSSSTEGNSSLDASA